MNFSLSLHFEKSRLIIFMNQNRNCYLIDKALRHFLIASVLTSAATQLAVMVDAIIVSHIVGPDALSAVNVSSPVITIVVALSLLLGGGGSVLAAKYIGHQQLQSVSHVFTVAVCSVTVAALVLAVVLGLSTDWIVSLICSNEQIAPYVRSYLSIFLIAGPVPLFVSFTLNGFVQSDGKPHLVTYAVIAGGITNVVLDLLLVGPMGIGGAAIATVSNYVVSIGFVLFHFMSRASSYRWCWPKGIAGKVFGENVAEGMPMMIGNLMLGVIVMVINILVMNALGAEGMYAWSVCLQVLLLSVVLLNGVGNALLSIGGMLVGEQDYSGLSLLTRRSLGIICAVLLLFVAFIMVTPATLARLFGADTAEHVAYLSDVLRIFSLVLIPFALTLVMRSLFQILEYRMLSILLAVGQLLVMALVVWLFSIWWPQQLWWGFPLSAFLLIAGQLTTTFVIHLRHREASPLTLIPADESGQSMDMSCSYKMLDVEIALATVRKFLETNRLDNAIQMYAHICCEELMKNIVEHSKGKVQKYSFDLHLRVFDEVVFLVIKDGGQPFNPMKYIENPLSGYDHLGLKLVAGISPSVTYKYMYGQNILFVKIEKQKD